MQRIYTKTGDKGLTGLLGGERVPKNHIRISAVGELDELNSSLGLCLLSTQNSLVRTRLVAIQSLLFDLGAEVASPIDGPYFKRSVEHSDILDLETEMDEMTVQLPALKNFILPGGSESAAKLHLARCVCRRAERTIFVLSEDAEMRDEVIAFVNRLSDWLFTAARFENQTLGFEDVIWIARKNREA